MATIDRLFIATNVELLPNGEQAGEDMADKMDNNSDRDLCRYEFYEILVRLAGAKYRDTGVTSSYDAALKRFLEKDIYPNAKGEKSYIFREEELYTLPVDDLLRSNLEGLQKVYNLYTKVTKKYASPDDMIDLFLEKLKFPISEDQLTQCFAYSKMSIVDELKDIEVYERMKFVEFLEFTGRIAAVKYKEQAYPFVDKLEYVIEDMLRLVNLNLQRKNFEIQVTSESDYEEIEKLYE